MGQCSPLTVGMEVAAMAAGVKTQNLVPEWAPARPPVFMQNRRQAQPRPMVLNLESMLKRREKHPHCLIIHAWRLISLFL